MAQLLPNNHEALDSMLSTDKEEEEKEDKREVVTVPLSDTGYQGR